MTAELPGLAVSTFPGGWWSISSSFCTDVVVEVFSLIDSEYPWSL